MNLTLSRWDHVVAKLHDVADGNAIEVREQINDALDNLDEYDADDPNHRLEIPMGTVDDELLILEILKTYNGY